MSENRRQILEMLMAGRVTVEQADQLLEALGDESPAAPHESVIGTTQQRRQDARTDDFSAGLTPEQLIALRDHGVSAAFIQQMRALGLRDLSVADFIELSDHGVDETFVRDLSEAGFTALTREELVALCDHGVDAEYARELQSAGLTEATPAQLITLYDHGVDADFVREMRVLGFAHLAPGELVDLRDHGVDSDFVHEMHGHYPSSRDEDESEEQRGE